MHRDSVKDVIIMRMFMLSTDVRTFYNLELRTRKIPLIVALFSQLTVELVNNIAILKTRSFRI